MRYTLLLVMLLAVGCTRSDPQGWPPNSEEEYTIVWAGNPPNMARGRCTYKTLHERYTWNALNAMMDRAREKRSTPEDDELARLLEKTCWKL